MNKQQFSEGMRVKMLQGGEIIDEGIVKHVSAAPPRDEIAVQSLKLYPGETTEFALIQNYGPDREGWYMLFEDPMVRGVRCYSQRGPIYIFEPVLDTP